MEQQLEFETFKKGAAPPAREPVVTFQSTGPISLNIAAFRALGEPSAIEFMFDSTRRVVGLRSSNKKNRNAYPVRAVPHGATYVVAGRAFMKYYSIDSSVTRKYKAFRIGPGILGVDLSKEAEEIAARRNGHNGYGEGSKALSG